MNLIEAGKKLFANDNWKSSLGIMLFVNLFIYLSSYSITKCLIGPTGALVKDGVLVSQGASGYMALFLLQFILSGYIIAVIRNFNIDNEQFLPNWRGNIWNFFKLGFKFTIGFLLLGMALFIFIAAMTTAMSILSAILALIAHAPQALVVALIIITVIILYVLMFIVPILVFTPAIIMNFSMVQKFSSIFNLKRAVEIMKFNKIAYAKLIFTQIGITLLYYVTLVFSFIFARNYYQFISITVFMLFLLAMLALCVLYANYIKTHGNQEV